MEIILILKKRIEAMSTGKAVSINIVVGTAKGHRILSTVFKVIKYFEPCKMNFEKF